VAVAVVGGIIDAVEMYELGPIGQHRQRLDLAAMGEAVAGLAVELLGEVAGLHREHAHAVLAVQRFRRNGERGDIALVPVEDEQPPRVMLGGGDAGLRHHTHVSVWGEGDRARERHVHRRDAEGRRRQHQPVHALGHRRRNDVGGEGVGAGRQMRPVLLDAAGRQQHQRIALELGGDLRLRQFDEIPARQH